MTVRGTNGERLAKPEPVVFDKAGAAAYLSTTVRHIELLVQRRDIPFYRIGRLLRFKPADLDRWLKDHRSEAAS